MLTVPRTHTTLASTVCIAVCVALASACSSESSESSDQKKICPKCVPTDPVKASGTAAGSLAGCTRGYLIRSVDASEAERLGFRIKDTTNAIERPIDSPMTWVPGSSQAGGPASGYEPQTRIHVTFRVDSYDYWSLDPKRCDGNYCRFDDGVPVEQSPCQPVIMMHVSGQLETLDGAINVPFPTQVTTMRRVGQVDDIVMEAVADLNDARGSLVIEPAAPPPHIGKLLLSIQHADSLHRGYGVLYVSVGENGPNGPEFYSPVHAQWGDAPIWPPRTVTP